MANTPGDPLAGNIPESLKVLFRKSLLEQTKEDDGLGVFEVSLFEFYLKENEAAIERMLNAEAAYVREQMSQGVELVNDSGIVAAEYFTKRLRYADVIYLCSLAETFLVGACKKLVLLLNRPEVTFVPRRSGGKWMQCKAFLQTHAVQLPATSWQTLERLWTARNCIVHDNGDAEGLNEAQKTALSLAPGIRLLRHELIIEPPFVLTAFAAFREIVTSVNSQLGQKIDKELGDGHDV
jgi:hypothetical protein